MPFNDSQSITIADENALRLSIHSIAAMAKELAIESAEDVAIAEGMLVRCREARSRVDAFIDPHIKRAFEQHRALIADKRKFTDVIDAAERELKPKMADWMYREDQRRLAEDREKARLRAAIQSEADKTADAAYDLARGGKLDEAAAVVESGAARIDDMETKLAVESPRVNPETVTMRTRWDFEITDPAAIPREYLMPDPVKIRKVVEALKDQTSIAGIRAFPVRSVVTKARK